MLLEENRQIIFGPCFRKSFSAMTLKLIYTRIVKLYLIKIKNCSLPKTLSKESNKAKEPLNIFTSRTPAVEPTSSIYKTPHNPKANNPIKNSQQINQCELTLHHRRRTKYKYTEAKVRSMFSH